MEDGAGGVVEEVPWFTCCTDDVGEKKVAEMDVLLGEVHLSDAYSSLYSPE